MDIINNYSSTRAQMGSESIAHEGYWSKISRIKKF